MVSLIVPVLALYVAVGLLFGVFFAASGAARLDPGAMGSPITFRILMIRVATALWPLLLVKILRKKEEAT